MYNGCMHVGTPRNSIITPLCCGLYCQIRRLAQLAETLGLPLISTSLTPNSAIPIGGAPSGLFFSSPRNITPRPFAPLPTLRNSSIAGVGWLYSRYNVLCHRSWLFSDGRSASAGSPRIWDSVRARRVENEASR